MKALLGKCLLDILYMGHAMLEILVMSVKLNVNKLNECYQIS